MEEMDKLENFESVVNNKKESFWKPVNPVNGTDEQIMKSLEEIFKFRDFIIGKKKTKKISEEQIKQHYNVYVYREYPYPPGTKNKKEFKID